MVRANVLKLVRDNSFEPESEENKRALIATTEPQLFLPRFEEQLDQSVFVCKEPAEFLEVLEQKQIELVFADFKALGAKWTGLRLLSHVRKGAHLSHVEFWMMADTWHPYMQQWVVDQGGKGYIKRSADALAVHILSEEAAPRPERTEEMALVEKVFADFAGPMRTVMVDAALSNYTLGVIPPNVESYIAELASKLAMPQRQREYIEAAQATLKVKKNRK